MKPKVTSDALRGLIQELLNDENVSENLDFGHVTNMQPDPSLDFEDPPVAADPVTSFEDLGPPVDDSYYLPDDVEELKLAVSKLVERTPPSMVAPLYKGIRKAVMEFGTPEPKGSETMTVSDEPTPAEEEQEAEEVEVSDFESQEEPSLAESKRLQILAALISEQGFNVLPQAVPMSPAAMKKGEDDPSLDRVKLSGEEEEEEEVEDVPQVRSKRAPEAPQPPGRRVYSVEPEKSGPVAYTGQADIEVEDEVEIDPDLAKMLGDQPRKMTARDREQARKSKEAAAQKSAEQSKVAAAMAEKAAKEKLKIAKLLYKDDKSLSDKLDNLEDAMMLDSLLTPDQVFEVEEEFISTGTASDLSGGGAKSFSDMSDAQRGKFAEILLDMKKSISNSAFRNIKDAGFMKFLHALSIGPDDFQDKILQITQDVPDDAAPIKKFLLKSLPWSAEFIKDVKSGERRLSWVPNPDDPESGDTEAAADILEFLRQNPSKEKDPMPGQTLLDDYTSLVHYYLASKSNFPGAEKSMRKFHFNKENGKQALALAVKGLSERGDKTSYDMLVQILGSEENRKEVEKQLGKGFQVPPFSIAEES